MDIKYNRTKCKTLILFFFVSAYVFLNTYTNVNADNKPVFSFEFRNESLILCLEEVARQSSYEIFVSGDYSEYSINIELINATIEASLKKILRDINHVLVWNDEQRRVTLYLFGSQKGRQNTKKKSGTAYNLESKPVNIKKIDPKIEDRPEYQSNREDPVKDNVGDLNNKDKMKNSNVQLDISGANTTFIPGTPTGRFDP